MSSLTFKTVIAGVHFDPKKGIVKIQLEATSYVSMDKLTTLGPQDESVAITLESAQTKINEHAPGPAEGYLTIGEEGAKRLKGAAERLRDNPDADGDPKEAGKIITELLTPEASGEGGE